MSIPPRAEKYLKACKDWSDAAEVSYALGWGAGYKEVMVVDHILQSLTVKGFLDVRGGETSDDLDQYRIKQ